MRTSSRFPARLAVLVPLATAAVLLAGCSDDNGGAGNGNGAGAPTSTGPHSSAAAPVPTATTDLPTPDTAQTATLLSALQAIDPALATDSTSAVQDAVALCGELQSGSDAATAVPATFPDVDLDASQQQAVVTAVTSGFCSVTGGSGSASASASAS